MVEYRHDPRTGKSCLMEVNGRFWGSLPLANATGAEFVWFTFSIRALGQVPTMPSTRHPQRARFVLTDMQRIYRILFARKRIADPTVKVRPLTELLHFFADYLRLRTRYYVFSFTDPKPFLADLWFILRNRVR